MSIDAFPLAWPPGWRRTQVRTRAKFVGKAGRWQLRNWHLQRYTEHRDVKTGGRKARRLMWDWVL
jgi:hypothetical protein